MRVYPIYADFGAGEIGPQSWGRIDLPFFHRGGRRIENFIVTPQGGATFRPGLERVADVDNHAAHSYLIPWEEPGIGTYFIECCAGKLKFYREDTMALVHTISGAPWTEAQLPDVIFDFDGAKTMMFTLTAWKPARLRHTGSGDTDWTFDQPTISIANYTDTDLFKATGHYPAACAFIQGRLGLGGPDSAPNVVYLSKAWDPKTGSDRYLVFDLPVPSATTIADDDAFSFPISANRANRVYWLAARDSALIAGTEAGEAVVTGGDNGITAVNHFIRIATHYGSAPRRSIGANDATLFIQKGRRKVREIVWNQDAGQYVAQDLTFYAEHVGEAKLLALTTQQNPFSLIYAPREDGQLAAMSYERGAGLAAWQRIVTDGAIESVAVARGSTEEDRVWVVVKRTINGSTRRTIEAFKTLNHWKSPTKDLTQAFYVDCGKTFDNGSQKDVTSISATDYPVWDPSETYASGERVLWPGSPERYTSLADGNNGHFVTDAVWWLAEPYTAPSPSKATVIAHGFSDGDKVQFSNLTGFEAYTVKNPTTDDFEIYSEDASSPIYLSAPLAGETVKKVQKVLTGLSFLEGKTVAVIGDGGVQSEKIVADGVITIDRYANRIHVGLPYYGYLKLMPLEAGVQDGTAQGRRKRIEAVTLRVVDSLGCLAGPDEDTLDPVLFRRPDFPLGVPAELITGDIPLAFPGAFDASGDIMIVQKEPLPLTISAVMPRMATDG